MIKKTEIAVLLMLQWHGYVYTWHHLQYTTQALLRHHSAGEFLNLIGEQHHNNYTQMTKFFSA